MNATQLPGDKPTKMPFERASTKTKRLKLLLFGQEGSGKTILSLQFPSPVVIDMERGSELYGNDYDFSVRHTTDPDVVMDTVDWLLTNQHEFKTVVLDPITIYWAALQKKYQDLFLVREKRSKGFKFEYYRLQPSDWGIIKGELNQLVRKLLMLDMNVILTAHLKKLYSDDEFMKVVGETFDGEKNLPYLFDTVLQMWVNDKGQRMARYHKDRTNILPDGEFEISYERFAEMFGEDRLSKPSVPVSFATKEQVDMIENYIVIFTLDDKRVHKMLGQYDASSIAELTSDQAQTIINQFETALAKRKEAQNVG